MNDPCLKIERKIPQIIGTCDTFTALIKPILMTEKIQFQILIKLACVGYQEEIYKQLQVLIKLISKL